MVDTHVVGFLIEVQDAQLIELNLGLALEQILKHLVGDFVQGGRLVGMLVEERMLQ